MSAAAPQLPLEGSAFSRAGTDRPGSRHVACLAGPGREQPHPVLGTVRLSTADACAPGGAAPFAATRERTPTLHAITQRRHDVGEA